MKQFFLPVTRCHRVLVAFLTLVLRACNCKFEVENVSGGKKILGICYSSSEIEVAMLRPWLPGVWCMIGHWLFGGFWYAIQKEKECDAGFILEDWLGKGWVKRRQGKKSAGRSPELAGRSAIIPQFEFAQVWCSWEYGNYYHTFFIITNHIY